MKISKQKTTWIAIGCACTLLGGLPALLFTAATLDPPKIAAVLADG